MTQPNIKVSSFSLNPNHRPSQISTTLQSTILVFFITQNIQSTSITYSLYSIITKKFLIKVLWVQRKFSMASTSRFLPEIPPNPHHPGTSHLKILKVYCTWWSMTNAFPQQNPPTDAMAFSKDPAIKSISSIWKSNTTTQIHELQIRQTKFHFFVFKSLATNLTHNWQ